MKIHEGAALSAAYGGMHDRKEATNEHTDPAQAAAFACGFLPIAQSGGSRALNPALPTAP